MIPLKLSLRNFMCYKENVSPLDFSGIHLACLSGDNGHGKSALLDAITWALWGRSRARSDDDLIHANTDEMEVEFEFMLGENHFRVIRKRQKRKSASLPSLDLFVRDGDSFRAITGNTIADTERKIVDLLRMDYETFINSAFLLQGRADEFTIKPPGERKQILADILGLSVYDDLETMARDSARTHEATRRTLLAEIQAIDGELANEARYQDELNAAQAESARLATSLKEADDVLRGLREKKNVLDLKAGQLRDLDARLARAERDIANAGSQADAHRSRIADYERTIAQRLAIEDGYASLQAARQENDTLNRSLARLAQLQADQRQIERLIDGERARLVAEQRSQQERLAELAARSQKAAANERDLADVQAAIQALDDLDARLETARQAVQETTNRSAALRLANDALKSEMHTLKAKIDELAGVTHCPLCQTAFTDVERERVRGAYQTEGEQKAGVYRQNKADTEALEQQTAQIKAEMAELEKRLRDRPALQRREAALAQAVADARAAAEQSTAVQARLAEATRCLEGNDYAHGDHERLAGVNQQMAALHYDAARHEDVRTRVAELGHFESEKSRLETALHLVEGDRANLARLESSLVAWRKDLETDHAQAEALRRDIADLPTVSASVRTQEAAVADLQVRERYARETLGVARQKLEHCAYLRKQRTEKAAAESKERDERSMYEELAVAFGKKGIQAMIIEQAVPEIEEGANALLARMTDNRMAVTFETQRSTAKGDTIETLDIKIADELGTRSYEMYSGGEKFRANFAIRIALSRLLARRAGARLQTLIIDEGFGTQDSRGRERLVEAINAIAPDFEKILVITHIEELKDLFPVRIEVSKTADGSQITVT